MTVFVWGTAKRHLSVFSARLRHPLYLKITCNKNNEYINNLIGGESRTLRAKMERFICGFACNFWFFWLLVMGLVLILRLARNLNFNKAANKIDHNSDFCAVQGSITSSPSQHKFLEWISCLPCETLDIVIPAPQQKFFT